MRPTHELVRNVVHVFLFLLPLRDDVIDARLEVFEAREFGRDLDVRLLHALDRLDEQLAAVRPLQGRTICFTCT